MVETGSLATGNIVGISLPDYWTKVLWRVGGAAGRLRQELSHSFGVLGRLGYGVESLRRGSSLAESPDAAERSLPSEVTGSKKSFSRMAEQRLNTSAGREASNS